MAWGGGCTGWSYLAAGAGAWAGARALQYEIPGADVFIIASPDNVMRRTSAELMAEVYPAVPLRKSLSGHETLLSIDKARRILHFDPQHSWRDHVASD